MLKDFTSSTLWSIDGLLVGLEINFFSEDTPLLEYFVVLSLPEVPPVEEGKGLGSCAVPWSDDSCRGQAQGCSHAQGTAHCQFGVRKGLPWRLAQV